MGNLVLVGGARGVGKSTALRELELRARVEDVGVVFGNKKRLEFCYELFGHGMLEATEEQNAHAFTKVVGFALGLRSKVVLLDSHYGRVRGTQIVPYAPEIETGSYSAFVLLDAVPEVVLARRLADTDKRLANPEIQRSLTIEEVRFELDGEKMMAHLTAMQNGMEVHVIDTTLLTKTEAAEKLERILAGELGHLLR